MNVENKNLEENLRYLKNDILFKEDIINKFDMDYNDIKIKNNDLNTKNTELNNDLNN